MKDSDRETLRARLRAADPYQGDSLLASDTVRIKARMRAGAAGARPLPRWLPAAAAAAMVVAVAVGVWAGARTPVAEEAVGLPAPVASAGDVGIEPSPDPVAITETQPGRDPARTNLAVANSEDGSRAIEAHAWIEAAGLELLRGDEDYVEFVPHRHRDGGQG